MNVAPKNPIGRLADTAINSLKDPRKTAEKVVEQAKGTAALGKMVAEQVGRSAVSKVAETAGAVVGRASGRKPSPKKATDAPRAESPAPLRPVPDVNEAGHTPAENRGSEPAKQHGDPVKKAAQNAPAAKAPAKKASAMKTPAKKAAPTPADVAQVVEAAVAKDPKKTAAAPAKKAAAKKTAATPTKKAPAKKAAPGDRLPVKKAAEKAPVKKAPVKKAPVKKAAKKAPPKTAEQVATGRGDDVTTPEGTPGAVRGSNPDTAERDLNQPGTEGIVEESTAHEVASESDMLRKAAEQNPEQNPE